MKRLDLTGQRFGRLTVIVAEGFTPAGNVKWRCRCDCDNETIVPGGDLRKGQRKSCGCIQREARQHQSGHDNSNFKHGCWKSPTYRIWIGMHERCENPNRHEWKYYGARGVRVSERWSGEHGFENFLADMGERQPGTTLGRFLDSGNYEPGNCSWMTLFEQKINWHRSSKKCLETERAPKHPAPVNCLTAERLAEHQTYREA